MFYRYIQPPYSQTTTQMTEITEYLREIVTDCQIVKTIAIHNKTATETCKWMNHLYDSLIQTMCVTCTRKEFNLLDTQEVQEYITALTIHVCYICYCRWPKYSESHNLETHQLLSDHFAYGISNQCFRSSTVASVCQERPRLPFPLAGQKSNLKILKVIRSQQCSQVQSN